VGEAKRARPAGFREVFAVAEFRALWSAELLSVLGDQLTRVALSVLVFERTSSAGLTALTYALTYLPDLVGGPLLSGLADRFPRRRVMVISDLLRAALVGLMAVPAVPLPVLALLLVLVRLANSPFQAAQAATVPTVLEGDRYVVGQTVRQITNQTGQLAGFAGGGAVVALLGAHQALAADAVTFLLSAALIRFGVTARAAARTTEGPDGRSTLSQMAEGARIIWRDPRLRSLAWLGWLVGFIVVPEGLAAPYADEIGAGTAAVGLLLASQPAGTLLGAFLLGRFVSPARRLAVLGPLSVLAVTPLLGFAFRPGLPLAMALLALGGAFAAYNVTAGATFMRIVPDSGRGQAFGIAGSGVLAAQGIGLATGGLLVSVIDSVAATVAVAGAAGILVAIPAATAWHKARST
jgi:MFS family permease